MQGAGKREHETLLEKIKILLAPKLVKNSIFDITEAELKEKNIKGLLLDCDNTLMPWNEHVPGQPAKDWLNKMKENGLKTCIVSNNMFRHKRITSIAAAFDVPCVSEALKPFPYGLRRALGITGTLPSETMLIGDQLFTDILGGNFLGIRTVLVRPVSGAEFPTTKYINRNVEKLVIAYLKRSGAWKQ